jgi:hypothetical protein
MRCRTIRIVAFAQRFGKRASQGPILSLCANTRM